MVIGLIQIGNGCENALSSAVCWKYYAYLIREVRKMRSEVRKTQVEVRTLMIEVRFSPVEVRSRINLLKMLT